MRYRLALDEPREHDKTVEVSGLTFVLDAFAASLVEELLVDYDDYEDNFTVLSLNGPNSDC